MKPHYACSESIVIFLGFQWRLQDHTDIAAMSIIKLFLEKIIGCELLQFRKDVRKETLVTKAGKVLASAQTKGWPLYNCYGRARSFVTKFTDEWFMD